MFYYAKAFNQNIGYWDVSNVTAMDVMFKNATAFNQDLSKWCVKNVKTIYGSFNADAPNLTGSKLPKWGTCPGIESFTVPKYNKMSTIEKMFTIIVCLTLIIVLLKLFKLF